MGQVGDASAVSRESSPDDTSAGLRPLPLTLGRRGPWTVLETRETYRNAWIRVREDQVLRPNGTPGIYGVVECGLAVGIVPVDTEDRVILVGQYRYPTGEYSWEVPTGTGDGPEGPLAAAQRELEEETGLRAERWTWLGRVQVSNSVTDQLGALYLAEGLTAGEARPDETEDLAVRAVPFADAVTMAAGGEISDAFSALALLRAWYARGTRCPVVPHRPKVGRTCSFRRGVGPCVPRAGRQRGAGARRQLEGVSAVYVFGTRMVALAEPGTGAGRTGRATPPPASRQILAAQHVYTRVPTRASPRKLEGWQTYRYTHALPGDGVEAEDPAPPSLTAQEVRLIEDYLQHQRTFRTRMPEDIRWQFFRLDQRRVVMTRIVPRDEPDRSGLTYIYLAHSLVVDWDALLRERPDAIFALWNDQLFYGSLETLDNTQPPVETASRSSAGRIQEVREPGGVWLAARDVLADEPGHETSLGARLLPSSSAPPAGVQEELAGWLQDGECRESLDRLLQLIVSAPRLTGARWVVALRGSEHAIQKTLRLALHLAPAAKQPDCSFTTFCPEEGLPPMPFWAVGVGRALPASTRLVVVDCERRRVQPFPPGLPAHWPEKDQDAYADWLRGVVAQRSAGSVAHALTSLREVATVCRLVAQAHAYAFGTSPTSAAQPSRSGNGSPGRRLADPAAAAKLLKAAQVQLRALAVRPLVSGQLSEPTFIAAACAVSHVPLGKDLSAKTLAELLDRDLDAVAMLLSGLRPQSPGEDQALSIARRNLIKAVWLPTSSASWQERVRHVLCESGIWALEDGDGGQEVLRLINRREEPEGSDLLALRPLLEQVLNVENPQETADHAADRALLKKISADLDAALPVSATPSIGEAPPPGPEATSPIGALRGALAAYARIAASAKPADDTAPAAPAAPAKQPQGSLLQWALQVTMQQLKPLTDFAASAQVKAALTSNDADGPEYLALVVPPEVAGVDPEAESVLAGETLEEALRDAAGYVERWRKARGRLASGPLSATETESTKASSGEGEHGTAADRQPDALTEAVDALARLADIDKPLSDWQIEARQEVQPLVDALALRVPAAPAHSAPIPVAPPASEPRIVGGEGPPPPPPASRRSRVVSPNQVIPKEAAPISIPVTLPPSPGASTKGRKNKTDVEAPASGAPLVGSDTTPAAVIANEDAPSGNPSKEAPTVGTSATSPVPAITAPEMSSSAPVAPDPVRVAIRRIEGLVQLLLQAGGRAHARIIIGGQGKYDLSQLEAITAQANTLIESTGVWIELNPRKLGGTFWIDAGSFSRIFSPQSFRPGSPYRQLWPWDPAEPLAALAAALREQLAYIGALLLLRHVKPALPDFLRGQAALAAPAIARLLELGVDVLDTETLGRALHRYDGPWNDSDEIAQHVQAERVRSACWAAGLTGSPLELPVVLVTPAAEEGLRNLDLRETNPDGVSRALRLRDALLSRLSVVRHAGYPPAVLCGRPTLPFVLRLLEDASPAPAVFCPSERGQRTGKHLKHLSMVDWPA